MKALITGCSGYIGSTLIKHLLNERFVVTGVDNQLYGSTSLLPYVSHHGFKFIKGDVRNYDQLSELIKGQDVIIALAALVGAPLCDRNPVDAKLVNYGHVKFLADNKEKDQLLIVNNTNSGYGTTDGTSVITEKDPLNPISIYGKTKCEAERVVQQVENHVSLRLATVFGASFRPRCDLLVNNLVMRALKEQVLVLYEGNFMRNYIHVHDVCRAIQHVILTKECHNQTFNVGNDNVNMSKKMLCEKIKEHLPTTEIIQAEYTQDKDKRNYIVSSQKLYNTGFSCKYDLDYGIQELIKMYNMLDMTVFANY